MTLDELRYLCGDGEGYITLVLPHQSTNGYSTRLLRTSGPRGVVVCVNRDGHSVVRFGASVIIRWLDQQHKLGNR